MYGILALTGVLRYKVKSIHSNQLLPGVYTTTQCNVIAIDLAKDIFQVCIMTYMDDPPTSSRTDPLIQNIYIYINIDNT